jgi:hypothetical protein
MPSSTPCGESCAGGCYEVDSDRGDPDIPLGLVTFASAGMSLLPELFRVRGGGGHTVRDGTGRLVGAQESGALPSLA